MNYYNEANSLIEYAKKDLEKIVVEYGESLKDRTVKTSLLISIKSYMEHLRSALDYTAHGLFEKYGDKSKKHTKIYFPYASSGLDRDNFIMKNIIESRIPGLKSNRPDIAELILGYQHFSENGNGWLPKFMALNNENKHQKLTPQTRKETKELRITSGDTTIQLIGNVKINLSPGIYIPVGDAIIKGNQTITPNNHAEMEGEVHQEIITWVSFHFSESDEPVFPFLNQALEGIKRIVDELSIL